jgi:hypothetical protein
MTADEIRKAVSFLQDLPEKIPEVEWQFHICAFLGEIPAQLSDLNDKMGDYFTIQISDEIKEGKR